MDFQETFISVPTQKREREEGRKRERERDNERVRGLYGLAC